MTGHNCNPWCDAPGNLHAILTQGTRVTGADTDWALLQRIGPMLAGLFGYEMVGQPMTQLPPQASGFGDNGATPRIVVWARDPKL